MFIDDQDYVDIMVIIVYIDIIYEFESGIVWKNEVFYDYMDYIKY